MENSPTIAYFSAEIGISASLPTYSGGLGVLAGDHIKAAADAEIPMVGITLLYKEGYFKQRVDEEGLQTETYPKFDPEPMLEKLPDLFSLRLRERDVWIQAYRLFYTGETGHVIPIYFLDTDIEENFNDDRKITLRLYSGDKDHRILQEAILGFGGVQLLDMLGLGEIQTYHMNEGHCSFLTLALLKKYDGNEEKVRSLCHFTTHTPVPAGHDHFAVKRCRKLLHGLLPENLHLPSWVQNSRLHMTELGLYFSRSANGVSELHGQVARDQFPDFHIDHITNGVYHPYWLGKSFRELFDIKLPGWRKNPGILSDLSAISDDELQWAHWSHKDFLLGYANSQTQKALSSDVLTIGFARRAAEYKRARLIFSDPERLRKLGRNKIQIIFAGKAHPKDMTGKEIIQSVVNNANSLMGEVKIIFLENYNMWLGRLITSGVDVWLNTPLRPNEASGTSGMKAALNGVPNCSVLDGWWAEGCRHKENGWAIGDTRSSDDKADAESLYTLLEHHIIPAYYGNSKQWVTLMRKSIESSVQFSAYRMIKDYQNKFYSNVKESMVVH
ncbi:MAG: alpha-glucan family phosphorylase [Candidatus Marinimicrobia bacterium]|jgi:starch phosphorylase|nr:alpha-glucan family phosphorylase [Candidatus Neomarinimicrobiota bacterium]MDP6852958.1 alpha-glucan family phosphorylase [Candidatus Neomarinimicrobiota bacterium]MDP6936272.1 alpha-glucan family phosphorylase [Candidatus Neomarinimicrobiota bacterium]